MILSAIRRRQWLFALTAVAIMSFSGVIAALRPQSYTAITEVVADPALLTRNPDDVLVGGEAWLRSPEAARIVARLIEGSAAADLIVADARWPVIGWRHMTGTAGAYAPSESTLVRHLAAHLSLRRVPDSYTLEIGFSAGDRHLAATIANTFAAQLASQWADSGLRIVSVADPAVPEDGPSTGLILAAGSLLGLAIGAIVVGVAERSLDGLTSGVDVTSRLGPYHLGSVPLLSSVLPNAASPTDAVVDAPFSGYAEAFRGILVSMRQASNQDAKVFAVTSAFPGEGKSTTAICLARSAALSGEAVVIVDVDSRQSGASATLAGERRGPGLVNLLRGACDLDDALVHDPYSGAWILPCSDVGEDLSPFVTSGAFRDLIEALRNRYDRVLVDTAPMLAMAITRSVLPFMDSAVMVVRWRATPVQAVRAALGMVPVDLALWSGIVLTQVDVRKQARYVQGDASAYYQQSSAYYR